MDEALLDERSAAVSWARMARDVRHGCRTALRNATTTLPEVLEHAGTDEYVGRLTLLWVLESLPGAGKVETRRRLAGLGLDGSTMLRDLDRSTSVVLLDEFTDGSGAEDDSRGR